MNYFKSALAGFGMSFIGTALCCAKMGTGYYMRSPYVEAKLQLKAQVQDYKSSHKIYKNICSYLQKDDTGQIFIDHDYKRAVDCLAQAGNFVLQDRVENKAIIFILNENNIKPYDKYNVPLKVNSAWTGEWFTIPKSFLNNNILSIPTALLGAAYHDYFGRDIADKFNEYFNTDISSYILDGVSFAILAFVCDIVMHEDYISKLDPFFPLAMCIIQGFVVGCTAAFGAYCGDETPKVQTHDELVNHDEIQDIIYES